MEGLKKFEILTSPLMNPAEINFILLESSKEEFISSHIRKDTGSEFINMIKNDPKGTLLLPFLKTENT